MGTASLIPGKKVKVNAGTMVHVWDFENCKSDTWRIEGGSAEHEFLVKSAPEDPALTGAASHLVLVQAGFEDEYEIRVDPSNVTEVVASPASKPRLRRITTPRDASWLPDDLLATLRSSWSTVRSNTRQSIRRRPARLPDRTDPKEE